MKFIIGTGWLLLLALAGCKKAEPVKTTKVTNNSGGSDIVLQLTATEVYSISPYGERPALGVTIELFRTEGDRTNGGPILRSGTTDGQGALTLDYLNENYYYVKATHDTLGVELEEVSTPGGTTSFLEVIFETY